MKISLASKITTHFLMFGIWSRRDTISVDGFDFVLTENLMFSLQRKREIPYQYWIDAICINQDDNDEVGEQVPLMRQIYENV